MEIGGFQRVSLIDYPGRISSIVFVPGCNIRCPYCHNADLVFRNQENLRFHSEEEILEKLKRSKGFVEAVEITGGEPTLQRGLEEFMSHCKELGLLVKLDTNGSNPKRLKSIIEKGIVDYVAMDIKSALEPAKYNEAAGIASGDLLEKVNESIRAIMDSGREYEFRTTVVPTLVGLGDLLRIAERIKGARAYYLQQFIPKNTLNPGFSQIMPFPIEDIMHARDQINEMKLIEKCEVRS